MLTVGSLIMLLIQGDFLKALWLMVFPLVSLTAGPIPSESPFCQVSGYFTAVGIEACDVAVLLICLHAAIFLLFSKRSSGETGLYPYRRQAYAMAVFLPLLLASLAFIDGSPAYSNTGTFCYLSTSKPWYRQYLSWVPRYIIFSIIIALKVSMYLYVRILLGRYSRRSSSIQSVPRHLTTPPLISHGLIPDSSEPRSSTYFSPAEYRTSRRSREHRGSSESRCSPHTIPPPRGTDTSAKVSDAAAGGRRKPSEEIGWDQWEFRRAMARRGTVVFTPPDLGPREARRSESLPRRPALIHGWSSRRTSHEPDNSELSEASSSDRRRLLSSPAIPATPLRSASVFDFFVLLREGPPTTRSEANFNSAAGNANFVSAGMARKRSHTRRQLRLLFLYPVIYILTWGFPFFSHALGYDAARRSQEPLWLALLQVLSLCSQGTMDCALFMLQEKPWQHVRGGFWSSVGLRIQPRWPSLRRKGGRTREEMRDDERNARTRRLDEVRQEGIDRSERAEQARFAAEYPGTVMPRRLGQKGAPFWWDIEIGGDLHGGSDVDDDDDDDNNGRGGR